MIRSASSQDDESVGLDEGSVILDVVKSVSIDSFQ